MGWDPVGWVAGGVSNAWNATGNAVGNFIAGEPIGQSSQSPVQENHGFSDPNANLAGVTRYGTDPNGIPYFNSDETATVNRAAVSNDTSASATQPYANNPISEIRVTDMAGNISGDRGDSKTHDIEEQYNYSPLQALAMQQDAAAKSGDTRAAKYYQNELDKAKGDIIQGSATESYEKAATNLAQRPNTMDYAADLARSSLYKSQGVVNRPGATTAELTPYRGSLLADSNVITKTMRTGDLGPYGMLGNPFSSGNGSGGRILGIDEQQDISARAALSAGLPIDSTNSIRAKYENQDFLKGLGLNQFYNEAAPGKVAPKLLSIELDRPGELDRTSNKNIKTKVLGITSETPASSTTTTDTTIVAPEVIANAVVPVLPTGGATTKPAPEVAANTEGTKESLNKLIYQFGWGGNQAAPVDKTFKRIYPISPETSGPSGTEKYTGLYVRPEDLGKVTTNGLVGAKDMKDAMGNVYNTAEPVVVRTSLPPDRIPSSNEQSMVSPVMRESSVKMYPRFGAAVDINLGGAGEEYNNALVRIPAKQDATPGTQSYIQAVTGTGDTSASGDLFGPNRLQSTDINTVGSIVYNAEHGIIPRKRKPKPTHSLMKRRNPIFVIRQINQITPKPTKSKSIKPTLKSTAIKPTPKPTSPPKIKQDLKSIINIEAINKNVMPKSLGKGFAIVLSPEKLVKSIGAHTKIKMAGKATGKTKIDALGLTNIKNITENINISGFGAKSNSGTLGVVGNINTMLKGMLNPVKSKKVKVK